LNPNAALSVSYWQLSESVSWKRKVNMMNLVAFIAVGAEQVGIQPRCINSLEGVRIGWRKWISMILVILGICGGALDGASQGQGEVGSVRTGLVELENESPMTHSENLEFIDTYPGKLVPFAGMAVAVLIVWIVMAMVQNTDRHRHETIRQYLEKGVEVPWELLVDGGDPQTWKPVSDLRKALTWLAIGLGIGLTGWVFSGSPKAMALGLVFDFIGIGYLIVWEMEPKPAEQGGKSSR
jgi:hypothetical protein